MSAIHPSSVYELTKSQRFDPKFIGIAEIYMQHKNKRKEIQNIFNNTHNNLLYLQKINSTLQKSLDQKQKELQALQKIKKRHDQDSLKKIIQTERKNNQLQLLKKKTDFERKKLKSSLHQRVTEMKSQKKKSTNNVKFRSNQFKNHLQENNQFQLEKRKSMYDTIKDQKQKGQRMIDAFYKKRNLQSLDCYNKKIKNEDDKSLDYEMSIEKMNKTISLISKSNQKKEKKLSFLEEDIEKLNPLKTFFSTRLNRTQFMEYSRKNSQKTISSKKPSQILLDDFIGFATQIPLPEKTKNTKYQHPELQNPQKQSIKY